MNANLILSRRAFKPDDTTLGSFIFEYPLGVLRHTFIHCVELPWYDNAPQRSCIPAGKYRLAWTRSNRFSKAAGHDVFTWEILDVPGRGGIRIHTGNYAGPKLSDSLGCPLPCMEWTDINKDGEMDGARSGEAMGKLLKLLEPFKQNGLTIDVRNAA